jgi:hypothetical protein
MGTPEFADFMARAMRLRKMEVKMDPAALGHVLLLAGAVKAGATRALLNPTQGQLAEMYQLLSPRVRESASMYEYCSLCHH